MRSLKVHKLTISLNADIVITCGTSYKDAGTTWIPKIVTCKTCKRIMRKGKK